MIDNQFYGWYDDASQPVDQHTYDPPHDGPCLFCGDRITDEDVRTHSIMALWGYANRSYFYRTHRTRAVDNPNDSMDGLIFNIIRRNGN